MSINLKKIFCFHSPSVLIAKWPEMYFNQMGDASYAVVGTYRCHKCGGYYEWYIQRSGPSVRVSAAGESKAEYAPLEIRELVKAQRKVEEKISIDGLEITLTRTSDDSEVVVSLKEYMDLVETECFFYPNQQYYVKKNKK